MTPVGANNCLVYSQLLAGLTQSTAGPGLNIEGVEPGFSPALFYRE